MQRIEVTIRSMVIFGLQESGINQSRALVFDHVGGDQVESATKVDIGDRHFQRNLYAT